MARHYYEYRLVARGNVYTKHVSSLTAQSAARKLAAKLMAPVVVEVAPRHSGQWKNAFPGYAFQPKVRNPRAGRKRNMRYGTSYFVSRAAAIRYYRPYGNDAASVDQKIREGEIHIGKPTLKPGERLRLIDGGTRYEVDEQNPRRVIPKSWTNAKVRTNSRGQVQVMINQPSKRVVDKYRRKRRSPSSNSNRRRRR